MFKCGIEKGFPSFGRVCLTEFKNYKSTGKSGQMLIYRTDVVYNWNATFPTILAPMVKAFLLQLKVV